MENAPVTTNRRLERGDGPLGGVAAGMANYFNIDPTIIRVGLVATTLLGGPTVPIVYLAGWLIIPAADNPTPVATAAPWAAEPPPPPVPRAPAPMTAPTPAAAAASTEAPVGDTLVQPAPAATDTVEVETVEVETVEAETAETDITQADAGETVETDGGDR